MPWISVSLVPGVFQPCCIWDDVPAFEGIDNLTDMRNSPRLEQIKQDMLDGKQISGCTQCYNDEKLGLQSPRQQYIERFGVVKESVLRSIDLALDNVCNLKCRGCASSSSHLWYEEEIKLYGQTVYPKKYTKAFKFDEVEIEHLERIDLSGGEPLMNKDLDAFFEKLIAKDLLKNIDLSISTNGTVPPSKTMQTVFANVKDLHLNISIDGIGDLNKYFRSGAEWNECLASFNYFDSLYDIRTSATVINAHTTVSVYNVNKLEEIEQFFKDQFPRITNDRRLLYWPEFLSIRNLPQELKDRIAPTVQQFPEILEFLNSTGEDLFEHFLNFHDGLDAIRNEQLTSNNLLSDFINEYKALHPTRVNSTSYWPKHIKILTK
jgi:sulfatase maturation enzyme AslB (radical SAM superfamily)